jgi:hypothetical protein
VSRTTIILAACLLLPSTAMLHAAVEPDSPIENLADYYGFGEMEIIKLDWEIDNLLVSDFNNDGLKDMAISNNRRSRIEFLMQKSAAGQESGSIAVDPADTDINELIGTSRFKKTDLPVAQRIFSMVCGDLNSDGLSDIAFCGEPRGLYVLLRKKDATDGSLGWHNPRKIKVEDGQKSRMALICTDFDQDGKVDLALAGRDTVYIAFQRPDGSLAEPTIYPTTASGLALLAGDLNGDRLKDLILSTTDNEKALHVRFGQSGGRLGPQMAFRIEKPIQQTLCLCDYDADGKDELLMIEAASGRLNSYKLTQEASADSDECPMLIYPLESGKDSGKRDMAIADVDGDGLEDVVVCDPAAAGLILYRQVKGIGLDKPETFPSISGAIAIAAADIDADKKDEIALLSVTERTIGVSRFEHGRLTFPRRVDVRGEPLAMDIADIDGDGKVDCGYVGKDANDVRFFSVIANWQLAGGEVPASPAPMVVLRRLQANPEGMKLLDVNGDGLCDVLILVQWETPVLLLQTSAGNFREVNPADSQAGLLKDANMRTLTSARFDDGRRYPLLAQKNFARSLTFDASGKWQIVDQFNASSGENAVSAAAAFDIDGDGSQELLLLDEAKGQLQILKASEKTYRFEKELEVGKWSIKKMLFATLTGDSEKSILLFDGAKFGLIAPPGSSGTVRQMAREYSYETKIRDGRYGNLVTGDINSDSRSDLIAVDTEGDHFEILAVGKDWLPSPAMRFKIMEQKGYGERMSRDSTEPRELVIADVTGDGKDDLVTVMHDRVLIYPQD